MRNILLTGGAGFIGSHLLEHIANVYADASITVLDKMTYAADFLNISGIIDNQTRRLVVGDVCDFNLCMKLTKNVDCIIHTAAESHVDNAFGNSLQFTQSNALGTHTLLEAARLNGVPLMLHMSTDEVYGEIESGHFREDSILNPSNPYSASKASAEMIVNSYRHSYNMPIVTVRGSNIYGIRQYPEKIIPKFCMQLLTGNKITLHGDGTSIRKYLSTKDLAEAVEIVLNRGVLGEIYNIGSDEEYTNIQIAEMICQILDKEFNDSIEFTQDRPFNDSRYSMDCSKMYSLGWKPRRGLVDNLNEVVDWYISNQARFEVLFMRS